MRPRCTSCGKRGHEATPDHSGCSKAFRAVRAILTDRLSMREAADLFEVTVGTLGEELRKFPEAHAVALARAVEVRASGAQISVLARMAAAAVHDDHLSVRDASRSYGVWESSVYHALKKLYPE